MKKNKDKIVSISRDPDSEAAVKQLEGSQNEGIELSPEQVYLNHREFLEQYKRGRMQSSGGAEGLNENSRCCSQLDNQQLHQMNVDSIAEIMAKIHARVQGDIQRKKSFEEQKDYKVFTDFVMHKGDINRISKQRQFIRSQKSNYFKYEEPRMTSPMKIPKRERVLTEVYEESELAQKAEDFTKKVQKEKERLWGLHCIRKRIEERRKQLEQQKEICRIQLSRQARMLEKYRPSNQDRMFADSHVLKKDEGGANFSQRKRFSKISPEFSRNYTQSHEQYLVKAVQQNYPRLFKQKSDKLQRAYHSIQNQTSSYNGKGINFRTITKRDRIIKSNLRTSEDKQMGQIRISLNTNRRNLKPLRSKDKDRFLESQQNVSNQSSAQATSPLPHLSSRPKINQIEQSTLNE